ncbi:MAG: hypothetical protein Q4G64_02015 [bacterium]|nr:hypothetical protein [bacterium]
MAASRSLSSRLLDGRHHWGVASQTMNRFGTHSIRLRIFPPGITSTERRLTRLTFAWPALGTVLAVVLSLVLRQGMGLPLLVAVLVPVGGAIYVGATLALTTARVRARIVGLFAQLSPAFPKRSNAQRYAYAESIIQRLETAEEDLIAGEISWESYRDAWEEAYVEVQVNG